MGKTNVWSGVAAQWAHERVEQRARPSTPDGDDGESAAPARTTEARVDLAESLVTLAVDVDETVDVS